MKSVIIAFILLLPLISNAQIISTVAGNGMLGYNGDGIPATSAKLHLPGKAIFDANGNLFIADSWGHRIRRVDAITDTITTIAGTGVAGYNGDNIAATTAQLNDPVGLAFDVFGNLYIADVENRRVRKIDIATSIITTFAGNGVGPAMGGGGYTGDGGLATNASINPPAYLAIDTRSGNLFFSDSTRVLKVNILTDTITTYAGNGAWGYSGDGFSASAASFNLIGGIAVDPYGNLFICDTNSTIRKINAATGIISTVAGIDTSGYTGDGGPATAAKILNPFDVAIDAIGDIYIAEFKGRVRKVDTSGIIHTAAGTNLYGYDGDEIPATSAELNETTGVTTDACGSLYIADVSNERIRKVTYPPIYATPSISLSSPPAAAAGTTVTVTATVANAGSSYTIEWMNDGIAFSTTTVPYVTYTKTAPIDTITARIVPTGYGCWDSTTSAAHIVSEHTAGVAPSGSPQGGVTCFPNPVHETLYINGLQTVAAYHLLSIVGAVMQQGSVGVGSNAISVAALPPGVYMLEIIPLSEGAVKTVTKIIKQ